MTTAASPTSRPLRLWPGVVIVVLLLIARFGVKAAVPGFMGFRIGMMAAMGGIVLFLIWWAFFSRARRSERWIALALMAAALAATFLLNHESMGLIWLLAYGLPIFCPIFVIWAVATRGLADGPRRSAMIATILFASFAWTAIRTDGITGDHDLQFSWRWTKSGEQRMLEQVRRELAPIAAPSIAAKIPVTTSAAEPPVAAPPAAPSTTTASIPTAAVEATANWPSFRGPARDSVIPNLQIKTDWSSSPPVELWRRPIGPGWSSFAVRGDFLYTQEQRADEEVVACYRASTGQPVWIHADKTRFFETNAGAGPRATPTLSGGRVYTFGATGILNALNATDGAVVWSRKVAADTSRKIPDWGFASSPLVIGDVVIVAAEGQLVAYDLSSGKQRWTGPSHNIGYSSPHLVTIAGVEQVLLLSGFGATSVAPATGATLWEHRWPGFAMVQPALAANGDLLLAGGETLGMRRVTVAHGTAGWTVEERWSSPGLKPYFNDFVVHAEHAYGFDGRILACLDLQDGKRKWKGGRYGNGQLMLLPEQDLLLVLSEEGELALVKAAADQFTEVARFKALEGKTWNHPAIVGNMLLVRNGQEMVAFRLPLAGS